MSREEIKRVKAMELLVNGSISNQEAAEKLGICRRQIIRLKKKYQSDGEEALLIHGNRNRIPVHRIGDDVREKVLALYREKYQGFNFAHFTNCLCEYEELKVSRSTVSRILKAEGIKSKKSVKRRHRDHRLRDRRECAGMLWQTDATSFEWFGKGLGYAALHAYIDDATGIVTGARFTKNECAAGYAAALEQGIRKYGLPLSIYSDRHTIFRSPKELSVEEELAGQERPLSNFGKGLKELGIEHITAQTPLAKGRVECLWGTLQDRLYGELKLQGIKTLEEANKALPDLIARHNKRFAVKPARNCSAYVPVEKTLDFAFLFSTRCTRKIASECVISYKNSLYVPSEREDVLPKARTTVEARENIGGEVYVIYMGKTIKMTPTERTKRADLEQTPPESKNKSRPVKAHKPAPDHAWLRSPAIQRKDYHITDQDNTGDSVSVKF